MGNGFGELTDPTVQRERFNADNEQRSALGMRNLPIDEAFLGALETGMPPASGMAIGLDRVVMLFADVADIDQILSF